jgi:hypothetical protein
MLRIPTGKLLAVMLGPLALNTCLKRLLLADDLHVGIMVPRPVHPTALPPTPLAVVVKKRAMYLDWRQPVCIMASSCSVSSTA